MLYVLFAVVSCGGLENARPSNQPAKTDQPASDTLVDRLQEASPGETITVTIEGGDTEGLPDESSIESIPPPSSSFLDHADTVCSIVTKYLPQIDSLIGRTSPIVDDDPVISTDPTADYSDPQAWCDLSYGIAPRLVPRLSFLRETSAHPGWARRIEAPCFASGNGVVVWDVQVEATGWEGASTAAVSEFSGNRGLICAWSNEVAVWVDIESPEELDIEIGSETEALLLELYRLVIAGE